MKKIINKETKKLVNFLTDKQKDLIARLEKGEYFDLRQVDDDLLFGLPAGIRQQVFLAIIEHGSGGHICSGNHYEYNVGLHDDYRLCELPEEERKLIIPKYVERCAFRGDTSLKIFEYSKEEYIPVLQVYLSKRHLPEEAWYHFIELPTEEIIEIMAHALVLSNYSPHILEDLAKLPIKLQDEIRTQATTIANDKKKK